MPIVGALHLLLNRFCSGPDVSIKSANAIEAALDDAFPKDDEVQDVVLALASYRPSGGEFLYDEAQIKKRLVSILQRLADDR